MKLPTLTLTAILALSGCAQTAYIKAGAGIKFDETDIAWYDGSENHPISCRIEAGLKKDNWTYGVSHISQCFQGKPFNDNFEYTRSEVFVDYTWEFEL